VNPRLAIRMACHEASFLVNHMSRDTSGHPNLQWVAWAKRVPRHGKMHINHYWTKPYEKFLLKVYRGRGAAVPCVISLNGCPCQGLSAATTLSLNQILLMSKRISWSVSPVKKNSNNNRFTSKGGSQFALTLRSRMWSEMSSKKARRHDYMRWLEAHPWEAEKLTSTQELRLLPLSESSVLAGDHGRSLMPESLSQS
jgi:hypothetical protein